MTTIESRLMTSVFSDRPNPFAIYNVELSFRDKILGGTPGNPKSIEGWIRSKAGVTDDEEVRQMMLQTMLDLDMDVRPDMSFDELREASKKVAGLTHTTKFKRNEHGLIIEARQVEAMLRECVNIVYPYEDGNNTVKKLGWGGNRKGAKSYFVEVATVEPLFIPLGRSEPDGEEFMVKHISDKGGGKRSSLAYHEYCYQPAIRFDLYVWKDTIAHESWPLIWQYAEKSGLGACRSQAFGRFIVTGWDKVA